MASLWIIATISAAFFQNVRSALQRRIKDHLSISGSTYVRFFYALPFSILFFFSYREFSASQFDIFNLPFRFFALCLLSSIFQICFTLCLLSALSFRSFAVIIGLSKLDVIFTVLISYLFLSESITIFVFFFILIGIFGAFLLFHDSDIFRFSSLFRRGSLLGLLSAFFIGTQAVLYRGAILELVPLGEGDFILRAAATLLTALLFQTALMGLWFLLFDRSQLSKVILHWRRGLPIGIIATLTSLSWFIAFGLQKSAYVIAVGQIELLFTFCTTIFFFRERVRFHETMGVLCVVLSILLIVLFG